MMDEPMVVHCCHCSWCKQETGEAFAINALIEVSNLQVLTGCLVEQTIPSESGQGQTLVNCTECKTTLWSHYAYAGIGEYIAFIRVNTLEKANQIIPDVHIYTDSKQAGVKLPENIKQSKGYYRANEVWRASALARRQKLFDKSGTISP
jgi:hypothetical protein